MNTAWAKSTLGFNIKESPARAPDPEHLKAVWSQAPDKTRLPAVNSLEGIADDLTALPFTLQDVKSEDGETPPPLATLPHRMSLHDVTRAFQQVPPSSSNATVHRVPPLSPSSSTMPIVQRQPSYTFTLPPPANSDLRPIFAPYPSPMMSHSPSPAMMYSHPIPSPVPSRLPVNGHAPVYSQPLWMPLPGPTTQSPGTMMRPLASPYPAQLMPYPSSSAAAVYGPPANMQTPPPQNSQSRGRGMPLMSPVMSHAASHSNVPLYAGSPVLVHASVMQVPQNHAYLSMPPTRRNDVTGQPSVQQPPSVHTSHNTGYTSLPPAPFPRPSW
jgi:serine/arginine repetitive matrix protein 2